MEPAVLDDSVREHFPNLCLAFQCSGLVPFLEPWKNCLAKTMRVYACFKVLQVTLSSCIALATAVTDPVAASEIVGVLVIYLMATVKGLCSLVNRDRLIRLVNRLQVLMDAQQADPVDRADLEASARRISFLFTLMFRAAIFVTLSVVLRPHVDLFVERYIENNINATLTLPLITWMPFDTTDGYKYYITYFGQVSDPVVCGIPTLLHNGLFAFFAIQAGAQLRHLQRQLVAVRGSDSLARVRPALQHHQAVLAILQETEDIFNKSMLVQLLKSVVLFVSLSLASLSENIFTPRNVTFFGVLSFATFELFIICYYSQLLMEEGERVREAVYGSEWYRAPARLQRVFNMVLMRTHRPTHITVAKFVPISLQLFASVLQFAYSFFTLLTGTVNK